MNCFVRELKRYSVLQNLCCQLLLPVLLRGRLSEDTPVVIFSGGAEAVQLPLQAKFSGFLYLW